ncbi:hypothetical protein DSM112329_01439 [Paraconexibacter sp. AEG42_29]|uniref:Uncharacterized protein n=1 Tax=Paraconexibacter sp. AEG42_29 TaxID=2997339 RepID=A0AAU7ASP2_9ACTN
MRISRPSPALVVSIIALVVAMAGTATAASVLIKNSTQVKAGALSGTDLANKTIKNAQLANSAVDGRAIKSGSIESSDLSKSVKSSLAGAGTSAGFTATESVRKDGPQVNQTGSATVAKLSALAPGTYVLTAKTVVSGVQPPGAGLVTELLKPNKTASARCKLDAAGDSDESVVPIAFPFALNSDTVTLQLTRTVGTTTDVVLSCESNISWRAANTSIIALKLSGSTRVDSAVG